MPAEVPPSRRHPPARKPPRGPRYRATVALAILFVVLAVTLPLWLDWVRQPVDRSVLDQDLDSMRPGTGLSAPVPEPPAVLPVPPPVAAVEGPSPRSPAVTQTPIPNTECRAYVFDRCNALRIPPAACLPIAQDGIQVPLTGGFAACRATVDERLAREARLETAETAAAPPEPAAPRPPTTGQPQPEPAGQGPEAPGTPEVPPKERAEAMERALQVVEDLQRGALNYATLPAAQTARLAELRELAERSGTPEARDLYNRMAARYGTPEPPRGTGAGEAPIIQAAPSPERAPATTPEMEEVRRLRDAARREAGLPPGPPAAAPEIAPSRLPEATENRL